MFKEGRWRGESSGDGVDGGYGILASFIFRQVLEREEGAEANGQRGRLRTERLAQAGDSRPFIGSGRH
ncbi:hypothetical protein RRF57_000011 [Xylaria bambusicola]|uniref:Uncharacterized protein n=1 Tax=Xylaria bambusicola TaxID=326684 RepID=A0AAN7U336_9PEZI